MATTTSRAFDPTTRNERSSIPEKSIAPAIELRPELVAERQARTLLQWAFVAAPILAGADKFLNVMTDWDDYLAPELAELSPLPVEETMQVVGAIEIAAGVLVAVKPKIGGYVVAGWLGGIVANLALRGGAWDIALRDVGLAVGALALARLAR